MNIVKATNRSGLRTHAAYEDKPLCGGGHGGATAQWQHDLCPVNCCACLRILTPPRETKPEPTILNENDTNR